MTVYPPISTWICSMRKEVCKPGSPCFPNGPIAKQCRACSMAVDFVWSCDLCTDEFLPGEVTCVPVGDLLACFACLKERMDALIESEANYPPVYGRYMIRPWDFDPEEKLFDEKEETVAYFRRFKAALTEYETRSGVQPAK